MVPAGTVLRPRPRAMCVDDEAITLRLITRLLEQLGFEATPFSSPIEAIAAFDASRPDLVISDIRMPGMDGLEFLAAVRARDDEVPVIIASGQSSIENALEALRRGATGMLFKPFTASEFEAEVTSTLTRARMRADAIRYRFLTPVLDGVALALSAAIEARDHETGEHCRTLGSLAERIAGLLGLDEQTATTIRIGGYLHDVGKIAIADAILLKPGPLTAEEYAEMQRHAEIGAGIVDTHAAMHGIAEIVRHHHERWDGAGYPDRIRGLDIPVGARIVAVADAWSAMTSDRVYRPAIGPEAAWEELVKHAGRQFDPQVVEAFGLVLEIEEADPRKGERQEARR